MQCEMCGKQVAKTRRFHVEGSVLSVGPECERFGKALEPGPGMKAVGPGNVPLAMEMRRKRTTTKDVFSDASMEVDMVPDFAARIQMAREKRGWSRQDLGSKVGERETTIHRMETGALRPTDEVARKIERELGIKLFEKIDAVAPKKQAAAGMTLGDILRDALEKDKRRA